MRYTRLAPGADGLTHFDDGQLKLAAADTGPPGLPLPEEVVLAVQRLRLARYPAAWVAEEGPVAVAQLWLVLAGVLDIEATDGEVRRFGPGSVLHIASGAVYRARAVGLSPVVMATAALDGGLPDG